MVALYTLNYAIFAIFLCLFIIETGIGVLSIFAYGTYRNSIRKYLLPIWGMDGTFAVFYLVNLIATYPTLDGVAYAYIIPVLLSAIFFLLRNVFVSYSEYIGDIKFETLCMKIYGTSTIIMSFIVISIFASATSGIGVTISKNAVSVSLITMLFNPFNLLIFFAEALIALFIVASYFKLSILNKLSYAFLPLAMLIALIAVYLYLPFVFFAIIKSYYLLAFSLVLMIIAVWLKICKSRMTRYFTFVWLFVSINLFGVVQYPYFMGGQLQFTNYLTNTPSAAAITLITTVCGSFLIFAIAIFVYVSYLKK